MYGLQIVESFPWIKLRIGNQNENKNEEHKIKAQDDDVRCAEGKKTEQ